jgi:hypothetical protein
MAHGTPCSQGTRCRTFDACLQFPSGTTNVTGRRSARSVVASCSRGIASAAGYRMTTWVFSRSRLGASGSVFLGSYFNAPGSGFAGEVPRTTTSLFTRQAAPRPPVLLGFCHSVRCTTSSRRVCVSIRGMIAHMQSAACMRQRIQRAARLSRLFKERPAHSQAFARALLKLLLDRIEFAPERLYFGIRLRDLRHRWGRTIKHGVERRGWRGTRLLAFAA